MPRLKNGLSDKQRVFIDEYLVSLNAKEAAIKAGYSKKTAKSIGQENLTKPAIAAAIKEKMDERAEKSELSAEWILNNLKEVTERCLQKKPVVKFDKEEKCMMQVTDENGEGVWTFDSSGANRSLELLGRHFGIFKEDEKAASEVYFYTFDEVKKPDDAGTK